MVPFAESRAGDPSHMPMRESERKNHWRSVAGLRSTVIDRVGLWIPELANEMRQSGCGAPDRFELATARFLGLLAHCVDHAVTFGSATDAPSSMRSTSQPT